MKFQVAPIYGWGWHNNDGAVDVPAAFEFEGATIKWEEPYLWALGYFERGEHPLSGFWISLNQRSGPVDGSQGSNTTFDCNLRAYKEKPIIENGKIVQASPAVITGYASVVTSSPV